MGSMATASATTHLIHIKDQNRGTDVAIVNRLNEAIAEAASRYDAVASFHTQ
jgi:hypothetical protein